MVLMRRSTGAAVCILESHALHVENKVRGLVRMVQVADNLTIVDLSIRGLSPGTYHATVRETGDISEGPESTGGIWEALKAKKEGTPSRGVFGTVEVGKGGVGTVFLDKPIQIWEMIGRSIVVAKQQDGKFNKNDPDTLVGVIARSAGVWDNDVRKSNFQSQGNVLHALENRVLVLGQDGLAGARGTNRSGDAVNSRMPSQMRLPQKNRVSFEMPYSADKLRGVHLEF